MQESSVCFTVRFEDPFWIGIYERKVKGKMEIAKIIFGEEPKDQEVFLYYLNHYQEFRFSPAIEMGKRKTAKRNAKRVQKEIKKEIKNKAMGTKSQLAISLLKETAKKEKQLRTRKQIEEKRRQLFELKKQKRKQKHRGK